MSVRTYQGNHAFQLNVPLKDGKHSHVYFAENGSISIVVNDTP